MNLAIKNASGMLENVAVIRYFSFNGGNYLIFTKNEIDESGYQKLYISKINNMIGDSIVDEVEWNLVRDTIKVIAKANKENSVLPVQDMNEADINGIQIIGQKPFKLTSASVSLLSANKNVQSNSFNNIVVTEDINVQSQPVVEQPLVETNMEPNISMVLPNEPAVVAPTQDIINSSVEPANVENSVEQNLSSPMDTYASTPDMNINISQPVFPSVATNDVMDVQSTAITTTPELPIQNVAPVMTETQKIETSNIFDFPIPQQPVVETPVVEPALDYKKLYDEQTLKLNTLTAELDKYKNIVEQLKNILK